LKPSNFLVDPNGAVTLIDFGISIDILYYDIATGFRGTLRYAAPEILNEGATSFKVDSWGLGITFAELILGEHPLFHGNTNQEVLKEIENFHENINQQQAKASTQCPNLFDDKLWNLIVQLLQIDPEKRIGTDQAKSYFKQNFPKELSK